MDINKGDTFYYNGAGGFIMSPVLTRAKVVHNDGENIHYVVETDRHNVRQTPIDRFIEIVKPFLGHRRD